MFACEFKSPARPALVFGICFVTVAFLFAMPLAAQTTSGSILGTVIDASGAVIPRAAVTVTNTGTAEKRVATTDAAGSYRFVNLIPGQYRIDVEMNGFKRFTREPITLEVQAAVRIDAPMQVGAVNEVVEVTSETPLLQTENTTLSHMVEAKTVQEMPLNGRNVMNLIALAPGVVPGGSTAGAPVGNQGAGHTNNGAWNNYQIGGGIGGHSTSFLDGAPTVNLGSNYVGLIATQEAVQEFRISTNSVSPEYGRFGGGVVNMATKSGTNAFHGSAYEFFTKIAGRHTWKFGGEVRLMDYSFAQTTTPSGRFTFTAGFTNVDGTGAATTGSPFASFMLGYPATGTLGTVNLIGQFGPMLPPGIVKSQIRNKKSFRHAKSIDIQWNFALGWMWFAT